ncbi:MAG: S1 RNA-binding domain-containing protein [Candidatus Nanoperiomorbaceae bacterium]
MTRVTMDELLKGAEGQSLEAGDSIDGKVLTIKKNEILVDLGARGVGLVPKHEIGYGKKYEVGEAVTANVIDTELDDGMALLSLRKAAKDNGWIEVQATVEKGDTIEVVPFDANRGGLLIEYDGVRGFMPVSQLGASHYPRTSDKNAILSKLKTLVGKPMPAQILDADQKTSKLIFSEKEAIKDGLADRFASLKVGDIVEGAVTGVVDFGAFVDVDGIEGLVHISEISWERVGKVSDKLKVGDTVKAKIISIDKDRLSLSIKQTLPDPFLSEVAKLHKGDEVEGTITRITPFGAFVQISPAVEALVHVSELGRGNDPEKIFTLNDKRTFVILDVDADARKISLGLKK